MKAWKRDWKIELIEQGNPQWLDLWICSMFETKTAIRASLG